MKTNQSNKVSGTGPNESAQAKTARRKRKGRWIIPLLVVIAATAALVLAATRSGASTEGGEQTVTVGRSDLIVTVTESGSIRAKNSIQYKCRVERRRGGTDLTILSIVPPGTYVTQEDVNKGMVLVELDSSALEDQLQEDEMELASDQENYTAAKESYDIQVIQNESDVAQARLRVRFALLDLEKYLGKELARQMTENISTADNLTDHVAPFIEKVRSDPNLLDGSLAGQELKRLRDEIVLAEGNLKTAEDTLAGTEKLHEAAYVSDLELERDRLNVVSRQFSQQNAQVELDLFIRYDFPKNAEQYLSDYIEAGRELERTFAECRSRLAQAQASLSNAEERFKSQSTYVQELKQQIDYCTIRAIAPGLVIYGEGGSGDTFRAMRGGSGGIIAEGEAVYEGQTLISMPDTAAMIAEISVHETEVDKVRVGQMAQIVMDAFPDRILYGKVLEVAPLPDQQQGWMNPDLKVYKTLVSIDGSHDFLKTRMSCKVEVLVRRLDDVLIVPIQVVANRGGRKVCYVSTPSGPEEREVMTGEFTDTLVQIVSGLEEGDQVLLNPPLFDSYTNDPSYMREQQGWGQAGGEGEAAGTEEPAVEMPLEGQPTQPGEFQSDGPRPERGEGPMEGQRPQWGGGQEGGQRRPRGEGRMGGQRPQGGEGAPGGQGFQGGGETGDSSPQLPERGQRPQGARMGGRNRPGAETTTEP